MVLHTKDFLTLYFPDKDPQFESGVEGAKNGND